MRQKPPNAWLFFPAGIVFVVLLVGIGIWNVIDGVLGGVAWTVLLFATAALSVAAMGWSAKYRRGTRGRRRY